MLYNEAELEEFESYLNSTCQPVYLFGLTIGRGTAFRKCDKTKFEIEYEKYVKNNKKSSN